MYNRLFNFWKASILICSSLKDHLNHSFHLQDAIPQHPRPKERVVYFGSQSVGVVYFGSKAEMARRKGLPGKKAAQVLVTEQQQRERRSREERQTLSGPAQVACLCPTRPSLTAHSGHRAHHRAHQQMNPPMSPRPVIQSPSEALNSHV